MKNLVIRKLKKEDAGDVIRIFTAINKREPHINYARIIEDQVRREEATSLVAEIQGKVVGFMLCYIISGGFGLLEQSAWIVMFGTYPNCMGQGIGKGLAEEVFKICREKDIKNIYLSVRWDSTDLLSFFKTLGFDRSNFINLTKTLE